MQVCIFPDAAGVGVATADRIGDTVREKPDALLALPTGNTPIAAYRELTRRVAAGEIYLAGAWAYAVDEFVGVPRDTPGTNSAFFREHLQVPLRALHIPNPAARDPEEHIAAFADAIRRAGGIDLCVLGVGRNGHIAFNEPGSARDSPARVVQLEASSREAHAASFGGIERVPERGMTLGVADLLAARRIVVTATGAHKSAIVRRAIEEPPSADVPASWLQLHDDCTWLLDSPAASELQTRHACA